MHTGPLRDGGARVGDLVAVVGLAAGAVFGIAGAVVADASLRQTFWTIDGVGLVVAATLLALRFFRIGEDMAAAGFIVFALGESLLVSGTAAGLQGSVPSFGGGVALWAAGLLLISAPGVLPAWVRVTGATAALLFSVVAARIAHGEEVLPTDAPLPLLAYPVLVMTFAGWMAMLLKGGNRSTS